MGTKEFGKLLKIIQTLEEGRVPAKEVKNWRIEGGKTRITRKDYQRLLNNFEGLRNLAKKKIKKERGELPNEPGDVVKELKSHA